MCNSPATLPLTTGDRIQLRVMRVTPATNERRCVCCRARPDCDGTTTTAATAQRSRGADPPPPAARAENRPTGPTRSATVDLGTFAGQGLLPARAPDE